ncbi:serine/threonine-protein kinase [Streptomyces hydrogenans]
MWDLRGDDPKTVGSFRLVARLGSGGMGTVYLAAQDGREGHVALKTIRSEYAQEEGFRRRFTREASAASSVRSPYTVRVVGFDTRAPEPWLATEYVEGPSLKDRVRSQGPLALPAAVELALGLSFGLASIHKAGLVHRDLKPGNVLLTDDGPKIIDFGLAYGTDFSNATHTGAVLGTPGYFSPEQVRGRPVSAASDIFALGAVLTFAASGEHAFRGVTPLTAQYHVVHEEPALAEVPDELRDLIAACMRKEPGERPPLSAILAHLTALRSYGHKKSAASFTRRGPDNRPDTTAAGTESATIAPGGRGRSGRRWATRALAGALLLATGAAIGPWIVPERGRAASGPPPAPAEGPATPSETPDTPFDPESDPDAAARKYLGADPFNLLLVDKIEYDDKRGCVLGDGMMGEMGTAVTNSRHYKISVAPLRVSGSRLTRALITVRSTSAHMPDALMVAHLRASGGQGVSLLVPEGRKEWSFRWPDVLQTNDPPLHPAEGPYTVTLFHGTLQACGGFMVTS